MVHQALAGIHWKQIASCMTLHLPRYAANCSTLGEPLLDTASKGSGSGRGNPLPFSKGGVIRTCRFLGAGRKGQAVGEQVREAGDGVRSSFCLGLYGPHGCRGRGSGVLLARYSILTGALVRSIGTPDANGAASFEGFASPKPRRLGPQGARPAARASPLNITSGSERMPRGGTPGPGPRPGV
jgi:hypothetical protein